jgi:hypothetical protein
MKNFKNILRILLTSVSLLGFLGGWATLAHSRKPIQPATNQPQALEPLAPLPSLDSNPANSASNGNGLNIFAPPARRSRSRSLFTTSGS